MIDSNQQQDNLDTPIKSDSDIQKEEELLRSVNTSTKDILELSNKRIEQLEEELMQLKERERDIILRSKAEIENVRRRTTQEIEKIQKFALERFLFELLPVIDNLERTLSITDRSDTLLSSIIEGIELTLKSLLDTVQKFGLESIHDILVPFNPLIHQAISTVECDDEYEPNQVLTIVQKGYMLNGRLIRPAMVTVSRSKSKSA